jgi:hypothetical protein
VPQAVLHSLTEREMSIVYPRDVWHAFGRSASSRYHLCFRPDVAHVRNVPCAHACGHILARREPSVPRSRDAARTSASHACSRHVFLAILSRRPNLPASATRFSTRSRSGSTRRGVDPLCASYVPARAVADDRAPPDRACCGQAEGTTSGSKAACGAAPGSGRSTCPSQALVFERVKKGLSYIAECQSQL